MNMDFCGKASGASRRLGMLALALVGWGVPAARAAFECDTDYVNPWYATNGLIGELTNRVAHATIAYGGHVGSYTLPGMPTGSIPSDNTYRLDGSSLGQPFSEMVPDSAIGEVIAPPPGALSNVAPVLIYPSSAAFFVNSRGQVIAADQGSVEIQWRMQDGTTSTVVHVISPVSTRRPQRLFWTEEPYYAPAVSLAGKYARIHYNSQVAAPVVTTSTTVHVGWNFTNVVVNVLTDLTHTVWIADAGGAKSLRAAGCIGSFVIELFDTGAMDNQIGWEVVQVGAPDIVYQDVAIGQRLLPLDTYYGSSNLQARVTSGNDNTLYIHSSTDGKSPMEGWAYSIFRTADDPWNAEIMWMNYGVANILWPFEWDQYRADWPVESQVLIYTPSVGNGAPVLIPATLHPEIMPMEEPPRNFALTNGVLTARTNGCVLLRYTAEDESVWFQVVRAVAHDEPLLYDRMPVPCEVAQLLEPAVAKAALAMSDRTLFNGGSGPTVAGRQPRTVELWAKINIFNGLGLFSMGTNNGALGSFGLATTTTNGVLRVDLGGFTTNVTVSGSVSNWHHYALTYDGATVALYYDSSNVIRFAVALNTQPGPFLVGDANMTGSASHDRADAMGIRVWAEARTAEQLVNHMYVNLNATEIADPNLLAYYPLNATDGSRAYDYANAYIATIVSPFGFVPCTAPVSFDASPWTNYPGFLYRPTGLESYNVDLYQYPTQPGTNALVNSIFPVHTNILEVWWANQCQQPGMPEPIFFPSLVTRYQPVWPTNAHTIVIAWQNDTLNALPPNAVNAAIYYQNDITRAGFNPNEEHALIIGDGVYAIRNDMNTTTKPDSSAPYVLLEYYDSVSGLPRMYAYHVVDTNAQYGFTYSNTIPCMIEPPAPLWMLANTVCSNTAASKPPAWVDRNGTWWGYRGGKDGVSPDTNHMNWCYRNQPGFYYPGENPQPAVGQEIPFLSGKGSKGNPRVVNYVLNWPASPPTLHIGDTLVKPNQQQVGLPDISDQLSVDILFQESLLYLNSSTPFSTPSGIVQTQTVDYAMGQGSASVVLIDPTRYRNSTTPFRVPSDIRTQNIGGWTYFPDLPPELNQRLWWRNTESDPTLGKLFIKGEYVEPDAGLPYLLLNVLSTNQRAAALALSSDSGWHTAINQLPTNVFEITNGNTPADSLALCAGIGRGVGHVVFAVNNTTSAPPGSPISLYCIKVATPLVRGEVKAIPPADPLSEQMTMRHTTDCAGHPEYYLYDWRYDPNGIGTNYGSWAVFATTPGLNQITFGSGQPEFTLSDNFFVCRYKSIDPNSPAYNTWSSWTEPMIAESWVKRAMNAINPYNQRITDYQQSPPDYTINMIALAGAPYLGDVALNAQKMNDFGLIQIYWTIYNRALNMSAALPGGPDESINNTLRYAATRLNALYMLLGNEAYGDAQDPTIGFSAQSDWARYGDASARASCLVCFMIQVPTLLDEELCLLRGRDDRLFPGVQEAPIFNRLIWNFSKSVDGGELAYALNYGIPDAQGNVSGTMSEDDAQRLYPQGHGDAWGHYLSALTLYYKLLHTTNYHWITDITAMDLGGVTVNVDYYDEEKFAESADALARVGRDIVRRTFQQSYQSNPSGLWSGYSDSDTNRAWGAGDWAMRAGQRAYFDWLTVNSLLPTTDTNTTHTGIGVIDRTTVRALSDLAAAGMALQSALDGADGGLNPLGLAKNITPFDISPAGIDAGKSHFEQIYERALATLNNAQTALEHAQGAAQRLRRMASSFNNYVTDTVARNERNTRDRLLEILGTPYAEDIGPGGSYPDGYTGPDLYHFMYTDIDAVSNQTNFLTSITLALPVMPSGYEATPENAGTPLNTTNNLTPITFMVNNEGVLTKPPSWTIRSRPGEWQTLKQQYIQALVELQKSYDTIKNQITSIESQVDHFNAFHNRAVGQFAYMIGQDTLTLTKMASLYLAEQNATKARYSVESHLLGGIMNQLAERFCEGFTEGVIGGLADGDITGEVMDDGKLEREAWVGRADDMIAADKAKASSWSKVAKYAELAIATADLALKNWTWHDSNSDAIESKIGAIKAAIRDLQPMLQDVQSKNLKVSQLAAQVRALGEEANQLVSEWASDRAAAAWRVQSARYADMTLRLFRDEALRRYAASYDLAARYAYMAASAYDYETALLGGDPTATAGSVFMDRILRTRSLGAVVNGQPQVANGYGDAGLADALARMKADWDVLKGRLGFNNPDTETSRFSLRTELFRTAPDSESDGIWRNLLEMSRMDLASLPEYRNYCKPVEEQGVTNEPGLVIEFSSTITAGRNFFGQDLAGGDNAYDPSHSATKIRSVGVWFAGYNNAFGTNGAGGLANAPRVYLVPVGADVMRSPTRNGGFTRNWTVFDQALPVPYNVSAADLDAPSWIPYFNSLSENFAAARRYASLRAYHDSGNFNASELCTNARLIGRSVWNTRWLLIIPGRTLLADPEEGLNRFIYGPLVDGQRTGGVTDIKLFFNTYSFAGD